MNHQETGREIIFPSPNKLDDLVSSGHCAACGEEHFFQSTEEAHREGFALMAELAEKKRIDLLCADGGAEPKFNTNYLFGEARGQMFGVMVCRDQAGKKHVLRAFSCQYNGEWEVDGWVGPLFEVAEFKSLTFAVERRIKELGTEIEKREAKGMEDQMLRLERRQLSQQLMKDIHALYRLTNFRGETSSLPEAFHGANGIPTGSGDCCAPKLLNHAAKNNLTPLGIAEFYWGKENRSATRTHGQFYSACQGKCAPILGFLLCGLDQR